MTALGPPPVEAMTDIAWARVERDLMAALDREPVAVAAPPQRTRWSRGVIVAGLALSVAAAIALLWPRALATRHDLPSRVVTANAPTAVSFGDAEITIAPASALVLGGSQAQGVELVLERGSARFAVAPRRGRPPFVIHVGAVDVRVIGTELTITRTGDAARVEVVHGVVEVVAHGRRELLHAGASWSSDRLPTVPPSAPTIAPTLPAVVPPAAVTPPPPAATIAPRQTPSAPPAISVDPRAAFEAATALESRDPHAALRAYRALARGAGPWSANALYAAARLAFDRGDTALAARLARSYVTRFPHGANATDADALVQRTQGAPR